MLRFLQGDGEMAGRIRAFDWLATPLGVPESWPAPLRTVTRLALTTQHPVFVMWGPELRCLYNDAFRPSLGPEQHPSMLGACAQTAWAEIWSIIGPEIEQVMEGRGATWRRDALVPYRRHGEDRPIYWTYSYSPIDDPNAPNGVGGVLVLCHETTEQVLAAERSTAAEARWQALFDQSPNFMAVLEGPEHRYAYLNEACKRLIRRQDAVGRPVAEVSPELTAQGFIGLLDRAYATGEPFVGRAVPVRFEPAGAASAKDHWLDFIYQPIRDADGNVHGMFTQGHDVTEAHRATQKLEAIGQQLREEVLRKDAFLATLSHELRNPLAPIRTAAALLALPNVPAADQARAREIIKRQSGLMARLLDDLLDIARVTRGKLVLRRGRVVLQEVIESAVETARPLIAERRHALTLTLPEAPVGLDADAVRLAQVVSNLLNNAARYTEAGGRIAVIAEIAAAAAPRPPAAEVVIRVRDNGIGIDAASLESIFEMFTQVPVAEGRSRGGLGIGLALVRGLVALHGGSVAAFSAGAGQGSEFVVRIPAAAPA